MTVPLDWPSVPCQCPGVEGCVCTDPERALRAWSRGELSEPMTGAQAEWCLSQVRQIAPERERHLPARPGINRTAARWLSRTVLFCWIGSLRTTSRAHQENAT